MIKKSLLFATSATLALAACNTAPSNNQIQVPAMNTGATSAEQSTIAAATTESGGYKSLIITDKDVKVTDFGTKALLTAPTKRGVIVKVGTTEYVLTYNYMNKFRTLLTNANYKTTSGAAAKAPGNVYAGVATAGFFARLKAASTATVAAVTGPPAEPLWCPSIAPATGACMGAPNLDAYTLSASETAFTTLLEAQNFLVMPDFLQENDATAESTTAGRSLDALTGTDVDNISFVNTKTIRADFYKKLNAYLESSRNTAANPLPNGGDHVYYAANLNPATTSTVANPLTWNYDDNGGVSPTGSLFRMNVTGTSDGTPAAPASLAAPFAATTAEKALLTSLIAQTPYVEGVALLNAANNIVSGNISIGFGLLDTLAADGTVSNRFDMGGYGVANVNKVTAYTTTNMKPTDTSNLNAASAVMMAKLMVDSQANLTTLVGTTLLAANGPVAYTKASGALGALQRNIRALHMQAGASLTPTTVAPAASLVYPTAAAGTATGPAVVAATSFVAPVAAATPIIALLDASCAAACAPTNIGAATASGVEFRADAAYTGTDNIFDALQAAFPTGTYKLGKDLSASEKNAAAITRFFHNTAPNTNTVLPTDDTSDANVPMAALIVPVTRTVNATTGAITYAFTPTGTSFVVVTAAAVADGANNSLTFYLSDPNAKPLEGPATMPMTATLEAALKNYTGTLVGVRGAGF